MSAPSFSNIALRLLEQGYQPLPIARGTKQPSIQGWTNYQFKAGDEGRYPACGTGLLLGAQIAVDIDVRDPALVKKLRALADKILGAGAPARIGMAPKVALVYAVEGEPFAKLQTRGYRLNGDGPEDKAHKVEILAKGQQLVAYAIHPDTGRPYTWNGSGEPLHVAAAQLPRVTKAQVQEFVDACDTLLAKHGSVVGKLRNAAEGAAFTSKDGLRATNPALLRSALAAIPNEDESYDDWILVCYATKGALGDDGIDDWMTWSRKSDKHDDDESLKAWAAAKPERIGAGSLIHIAKQFGWQRPNRTTREITIDLLAGESAAALSQLVEAMPAVAEAEELMAYGGQLVHPYLVKRQGFGGADVEILALNRLSVRGLGTHVDAQIGFTQERRQGKGWVKVATDAPDKLLQSYLSRADLMAQLPQQALGISTTPVLRADRTLATAYGFDAQSRMWIQSPTGIELPGKPTVKDAREALAVLQEYLKEFRFADQRAATAAIGLLMTAALRSSMDHAPLFLVNKHEHGEGGSTLCSLAAIVQTGRKPAVITVDGGAQGGDAELEKHLNAGQLEGRQTLVLDNYQNGGVIKLVSLATIITESERNLRVLGESRTVTVPCMALVLVNGRNVTVANDFVRRTVEVSLDTKMSAPETRRFNRPNLLEDAVGNRVAILTACYTIVSAYLFYLKRGAPRRRVERRAGFETWVKWVAEPLRWLGLEDIAATPAKLRAADPELALLERLLPAWVDVCRLLECPDGVPVSKIIGSENLSGSFLTISDILGEATNSKRFRGVPELQPRAVGIFLGRIEGRLIGNRRLIRAGTTDGSARWKVETLEGVKGMEGDTSQPKTV